MRTKQQLRGTDIAIFSSFPVAAVLFCFFLLIHRSMGPFTATLVMIGFLIGAASFIVLPLWVVLHIVFKRSLVSAGPGASAIQCCYAATERRESSTLTDTGESKNANVTLRSANKSIVDEKISLNVSRLVTNPACMAGVLSSRPNFSAL